MMVKFAVLWGVVGAKLANGVNFLRGCEYVVAVVLV